MMTNKQTTPATVDWAQYPPGDFRWRLWLLIGRINEVFKAAQKARMWRMSLIEPRGRWATDNHDRDPFAGAVWNIDQITKPDHLPDPWPAMYLNDAEWCCQEAEQCVVNHKRSERLRQTPRYKEVHARICNLGDIWYEVCKSMWKDGVSEPVCDCPIDDELYSRLRKEAIYCIERDDLDGAERYCRDAERVLAGEKPESGRDCAQVMKELFEPRESA
jgi:hypothetical protein